MEIKVGGSKNKVRDVEPKIAFGYIERSGIKWGSTRVGSSGSYSYGDFKTSKAGRSSGGSDIIEYLIDKWWIPKNVKWKYGDIRQLGSLSQEMGRTRTLERSINKHIPNTLERHLNKRESLNKKSPQYNRSLKCINRKIADEKLKLKEYKIEWRYRKRLVYTLSKSIIPSFTILRRDKYNVVQCKWRFMGNEQKRIHLGTMEAVGELSDDVLKKRALQMIQKKFADPIDSMTMQWIKSENERLNKWCEDMNYRVSKD